MTPDNPPSSSNVLDPAQKRFSAISRPRLWSGRVLSGFAVLFFFVDSGMKLFKPPIVVTTTLQLGYPETTIVGIGIALLLSTLLYVIPRTSVLGAVLLTGYLGGAVATHVRVAAWANVPFPVFFACLVWGGLWLRDRRIGQLLPLTSAH